MVRMVIHFPSGGDDHWADDDRAVVVMDMIGMPMWISRIVAMPSDMETNMDAVMPVVPVMAPVMAPVMVDMASVTFAVPVMAIVLPVVSGPVSRMALDVFARSWA